MTSMTFARLTARRGGLYVVFLAALTLASRQPVAAQETDGRLQPGRLLSPRGQSPPELTHVPSDVRDKAGMFSADALRQARDQLQKLERSLGVPVLIDTIETLKGETIDEVAMQMARRSGAQGVFILIARKEAKMEVLVSRRYREALPRPARIGIRSAFTEGFRKKDFDGGLREGIEVLTTALASASKQSKLPLAEQPTAGDASASQRLLPHLSASSGEGRFEGTSEHQSSGAGAPVQGKSLVVRNQVRLTLDGARVIIAAAAAQATSMNLRMNIAVVDDGGHLLSFDRMDGARPASGYTAITKATTAATFRQATGPIPAGTTSPDPLLNLSLQNAAQASGGKITTLFGGVPVVVEGQVIGGVGVGGGSGDQDAQVARAGTEAFLKALKIYEP